jgi:hypothetical protein
VSQIAGTATGKDEDYFARLLRSLAIRLPMPPRAHARTDLGTQRRPYVDTLDWLLVLGRRHLERTPRSYTNCNRERSHRGLGLLTLESADTAPAANDGARAVALGRSLIARLLDPDEAGAELATIGRLPRTWRRGRYSLTTTVRSSACATASAAASASSRLVRSSVLPSP